MYDNRNIYTGIIIIGIHPFFALKSAFLSLPSRQYSGLAVSASGSVLGLPSPRKSSMAVTCQRVPNRSQSYEQRKVPESSDGTESVRRLASRFTCLTRGFLGMLNGLRRSTKLSSRC